MNILKHELRLYKKSTITWTLSLVFVVVFFSLIFPSFKDSASAMEEIMKNFPEGLKKALGISSLNMSDIIGFYGFLFSYIALVGSVQAMNLGLSLLANEVMDKTADFLMAKPVRRIQIVHAKLSAGLIHLLLTNLVFNVVSFIALTTMSEDSISMKMFWLFNLTLLFIQLFFMSIGMLMSVFLDKMKTVVPVSLGVVFGFFVLNLLNESLADRPLSLLTPFAYFATSKIYETGSYDLLYTSVNFVLVVSFIIGAYVKYIKKDMPSV